MAIGTHYIQQHWRNAANQAAGWWPRQTTSWLAHIKVPDMQPLLLEMVRPWLERINEQQDGRYAR